jgi:ferrochelatase
LTKGVVVMAYGTPASPDDIETYFTHIRRGRPPTPELLDELRARYDAIGGVSPLREITEAQRVAIANDLGDGFVVKLGYKHTTPFIEDAVDQLGDDIVGVVLAPHYSRGSIGEYVDRLAHPTIESWHDLPEWLDFQADAVRTALASMPVDTTVVFTAHSLPERVLEGDMYIDELATSAAAIAERAGIDDWSTAFQSAGRTPDPWRGPDIREVIGASPRAGMVVCPQGFTADSLEILFDLDIDAKRVARDRGIALARTPMVNADARVLGALAARVRSFSR